MYFLQLMEEMVSKAAVYIATIKQLFDIHDTGDSLKRTKLPVKDLQSTVSLAKSVSA